MVNCNNVTYYELKDLKSLDSRLTITYVKSLLFDMQIAKQSKAYCISEYPIWVPFEFDFPENWEAKFKENRELCGKLCLIKLKVKIFRNPSNSQKRYYRADNIPGGYYVTDILLTQEALDKLKKN